MNDAEKLRKLAEDIRNAFKRGCLGDPWKDDPAFLLSIADRLERDEKEAQAEMAIGQHKTLPDGTVVECVEGDGCDGCYFVDNCSGNPEAIPAGLCCYEERSDDTDVIFRKVEQSNNPGELEAEPKNILDPTLAVGDVAIVGGEPMECVYVAPTEAEILADPEPKYREVPIFKEGNSWWFKGWPGEETDDESCYLISEAMGCEGFAGFRDHTGAFQPVPIGVREGWVVLFEEKKGA